LAGVLRKECLVWITEAKRPRLGRPTLIGGDGSVASYCQLQLLDFYRTLYSRTAHGEPGQYSSILILLSGLDRGGGGGREVVLDVDQIRPETSSATCATLQAQVEDCWAQFQTYMSIYPRAPVSPAVSPRSISY
jgi:hypothetical protein